MGFNSRSSRNQSKITAWCHKSYILPSVFYLSFGRICNLIVLYFRIYNPNRNIFLPDVNRIANPDTRRRKCRLQETRTKLIREINSLMSDNDNPSKF